MKKSNSIAYDSQEYELCSIYEETIKKQRRLYRKWGTTEPSLSVLEKLVNYDTLTATELSEKLSVPKQTMTDILDSLEKKKYIVRISNVKDRRKILIKITDKGIKYEEENHAPLREAQIKALKKLTKINREKLVMLTCSYTLALEQELEKIYIK